MPVHIALLRGINVAGRKMVAMAAVRDLFTHLGFTGARTLLQSGNVVFRSDRSADAALERLLERETAKRLGVTADYIVRSADEWEQVVAGNPFPKQAKDDPGHLVVIFLKSAPRAGDVDALRASIKGPELIRADGRQLYIVYPEGIGRSKLTGTSIERRLGTRGTARNWNTILKLLAICRGEPT